MSRPPPQLSRDFLFIANFWLLVGCCVYFDGSRQNLLEFPTQLAGTSHGDWQYPPLHTIPWYLTVTMEVGMKWLAVAFPFITGAAYTFAVLLTLSDVRHVLYGRPPWVFHILMVLLCLASSIIATTHYREVPAVAVISWSLSGLPALIGILVPRVRRHALQVIGFMSGVQMFAMGLFGNPAFVIVGSLWSYTAAFIWMETINPAPKTTAEPAGARTL